MSVEMNNYLNHSAAGTHWKKKNAKYIRKEGNRYIYADGSSTSVPAQPQVQQHISVPKNLQSTQGVSRTVINSTPKNYEANLVKGSSAPKNNQGISKYATAADRHTDGQETKEVTAADRTSAKQKAATKKAASGKSSAIKRHDEIDYSKHLDKSKGNKGHETYDSRKLKNSGGGSGQLSETINREGGKNYKAASLNDMLKALSTQKAGEQHLSNMVNEPQIDNLYTESLGALASYGANSKALKSGFDAVERMFKKKA